MAIVVVVIPIAIGMPTMAVFIPPAMPLSPALFASLVQFVTPALGLPAVPAVMFDGFVEFVICLGDAPLASVVVISVGSGCSRERQHANKHSGR
jgi:hypothetical protein